MSSDHRTQQLDPATAATVVEQFRYGLPPIQEVAHFTAAPPSYCCALRQRLYTPPATARSGVVQAGAGEGKSHILRFLGEAALDAGYAVSLIDLPNHDGWRFDRMDTIFGAICQQVHTPMSAETGVGALFSAFSATTGNGDALRLRQAITTRGRWDYSEYLGSPALYVALRAWVMGDHAARELVETWLSDPTAFQTRRTLLYDELVYRLRARFKDPRPPWKVASETVLALDAERSDQGWNALAGLDMVARASGLRGLVVLLDGVDDMAVFPRRTNQRQLAQHHLLRLLDDHLPGIRYAAAAPAFIERWHRETTQDGPPEIATRVAMIPSLMPPVLAQPELRELATKIRAAHGIAYGWSAAQGLPDRDTELLVARLHEQSSTGDMRPIVQGVVSTLDSRLERGA